MYQTEKTITEKKLVPGDKFSPDELPVWFNRIQEIKACRVLVEFGPFNEERIGRLERGFMQKYGDQIKNVWGSHVSPITGELLIFYRD